MIWTVFEQDAEADLDRFITYLLFEKKSEQAARNLLNDFEVTKTSLSNVAGSLKFCDNPKLRELGYRICISVIGTYQSLHNLADVHIMVIPFGIIIIFYIFI